MFPAQSDNLFSPEQHKGTADYRLRPSRVGYCTVLYLVGGLASIARIGPCRGRPMGPKQRPLSRNRAMPVGLALRSARNEG